MLAEHANRRRGRNTHRQYRHLPKIMLILAVGLGACTVTISPEPYIESPPLVEKLPLTVGIHYTDQLRTYSYGEHETHLDWKVSPGPPSITLFDQVFAALFEHVLPIDADPATASPYQNIDGIIAVRLNQFWGSCGDPCFIDVEYGFTLYDADGSPLGSWAAAGNHRDYSVFPFRGGLIAMSTLADDLEGAASHAMEAAAAQFMAEFRELPEVQAWLAKLPRRSSLEATP